MTDIVLRLLDCVNKEIDGNGEKTYELYVTFKGVRYNQFISHEAILINVNKEEKVFKAIILRISNTKNVDYKVELNGKQRFTVSVDVSLKLAKDDVIRVFYWNDSEESSLDIEIFEKHLYDNGYDNLALGERGMGQEEGLVRPKEAGNGGVVGVISC